MRDLLCFSSLLATPLLACLLLVLQNKLPWRCILASYTVITIFVSLHASSHASQTIIVLFLVVVNKIRHFMAGLVFHGQSFHAAHIRYVIENSLLLDLATGLVENDKMKKDH